MTPGRANLRAREVGGLKIRERDPHHLHSLTSPLECLVATNRIIRLAQAFCLLSLATGCHRIPLFSCISLADVMCIVDTLDDQ